MRSTAISIILGIVIILAVGYGGYYVVKRLRASADIEGAPSSTTTVNVDLNNDGTVNALDLNMMTKAISEGSSDKKYDLNGDGKLNSLDLNVFLNNYR